MPCKSFMTREASATGRARGITALAVNNNSSKLLASSADHHIYMFDCIVPEREPEMYTGHVNSSFYVKSTFSPDGRFIMSGSTDNHVYLWDVAHPLIPPLRLKGHTGEVSDVAWSPTEFWKLASSSDDTTVRIWTIDREMREHLRKHETLGHGAHDGMVVGVGRADNAFINPDTRTVYHHDEVYRLPEGAGAAEVPSSWSQPLLHSEEDMLTCHETMMFSDTLSSSQETAETVEFGEGRSSQASVVAIPSDDASPTATSSRLSPTSSPSFPGVMIGETNGGFGAQNTTPRTVQAPRSRVLSGSDERGRDRGSPTLKQARIIEFFNQITTDHSHAEIGAAGTSSGLQDQVDAAAGQALPLVAPAPAEGYGGGVKDGSRGGGGQACDHDCIKRPRLGP